MKEYSIVAIIWEDHAKVDRGRIPKKLGNSVETTLSVGIIVDETDKILLLASDVERYMERDDCTYLLLYKAAILSQKIYGTIKLTKIRR